MLISEDTHNETSVLSYWIKYIRDVSVLLIKKYSIYILFNIFYETVETIF